MAFLLINGQELPPPSRGVSVKILTLVDSDRNASGVFVGQKVGRDQLKLEGLEWPWLAAEEWMKILELFDAFVVNATFVNPRTNEMETRKVYPGDRVATPYWIDKNGKPTHYRNCKVNLIDTGA